MRKVVGYLGARAVWLGLALGALACAEDAPADKGAANGGSAGLGGRAGGGGAAARGGGGVGAAGRGAAAGAGGAAAGAGGAAGSSGRASGGTGAATPSAGGTGSNAGGTAGGGRSALGGRSSAGAAGDDEVPEAGANGEGGGTPAGALTAPVFDGESGYVEIPDADVFSEPTTGELSVEAWMRPDSLDMPNRESSGYVHWMGKGESGEHEWVSRMYQEGNDEDRANRISFYSFNKTGGLGAGSYFQDDVSVGAWIHYAGTFDDERTYIYKNGVERDSDLLSGYDITPENGSAPVRIATRDRSSYFQGAIARVAIYGSRLSEETIAAHFAARGSGYDAVILAEPSLVAYYRLDETSGTVAVDAKGGRNGSYHGGVALAEASWPTP